MELPNDIRIITERETAGKKLAEIKDISAFLSEKYLAGIPPKLSYDMAAVYSVVRMPATYSAIRKSMEEVKRAFPDESEINSALDFGSGTGAAVLASREIFGAEKFVCIERENSMTELAKKIFSEVGLKDTEFYRDLTAVEGRKFDLVTAGYAINELDERECEKVLKKLWEMTGKILLIVEPGAPQFFKKQQKYREFLQKIGGKPFAPCICDCPMKEDWCHFTVRVNRGKLHRAIKGEAPFEDEKFTFSAFKAEGEFIPQRRVLRHPMIREKSVEVTFCDNGEIETRVFRKGDPEYKIMRKIKPGEAF